VIKTPSKSRDLFLYSDSHSHVCNSRYLIGASGVGVTWLCFSSYQASKASTVSEYHLQYSGMHKVLVPKHSGAHRVACKTYSPPLKSSFTDNLISNRSGAVSSTSPTMLSINRKHIMARWNQDSCSTELSKVQEITKPIPDSECIEGRLWGTRMDAHQNWPGIDVSLLHYRL